MKIIVVFIALFFLISCEDGFEKVEVSECLNGVEPKTEITEEQDEEVPDEDIIYDNEEIKRSVTLIEKTKDYISFDFVNIVPCAGYEFGYDIESDPTDLTQLILETKSRDIWPNEDVYCVCPRKMTVEYSDEEQDLTKITKIKIDHGEDYVEVLELISE